MDKFMNKINKMNDFKTWHVKEPFEDHVGPFYYKIENGKPIAAFEYKDYHTNSIGSLHGGMIMSFTDYALFIIGHKHTSVSNYVTISCSTDFLKASFKKGLVFSSGDIVKVTNSLLFLKGKIFNDEGVIASFNGVLKKIN